MSTTRTPSRLLPVPSPPHDPYSLLLAGHIGPSPEVGWRVRALARAEIDAGTRALVLAPGPAAARWLTEPDGTFGGLRPPAHVAVTRGGDVLLLDRFTGELRRLDRCDCRFVRVPCIAGLVTMRPDCAPAPTIAPPGQVLDPQGIAVCGGDLFVADRGHHRVLRYAVGTWVPRGTMRLPGRQRATLFGGQWHPTGIAGDGRGRLAISDPVNGRIDRFDLRGRWLGTAAVPAGVSDLAIDCDDRVLAIVKRDAAQAVPASAGVQTFELDAGHEGTQWQTLRLSAIPDGLRVAIDVHAGDARWTAAERNDPANRQWTRWLDASALRRALAALPFTGLLGRYLRVRLVPEPASVPSAFDIHVAHARAIRVTFPGARSPEAQARIESLPAARADRVGGFGRPPVAVDLNGHLHLHCEAGVTVFDGRGERVDGVPRSGARFEREGRYRSTALDSGIDECQWHRIELRGAIPPGCALELRTTTAAIELTAGELDTLPGAAWTPAVVATAMDPRRADRPGDGSWDCLVAGLPGRYLWLELVLRGDGRQTPCVSGALIEYPRVTLRRYLPGVFGVDPAGADFTDRFTAIFDKTLRSIEGQLDHLALLFDPRSAPAGDVKGGIDFLTWLGEWIGVTLSRDWPVARRRRFLASIARLYPQRGTADGLRQQLLLLLGFGAGYPLRCEAVRPARRCGPRVHPCAPQPRPAAAEPPPLLLEHFKLRRWLYAGHGRLGADSLLWGKRIVNRSELSGADTPPSGNAQVGVTTLDTVPDPLRDPFHVYAHRFSVFVPARLRDNPVERRAVEQLLAREAPAHTAADIQYVEPRFRVGVQATIGLDAVVARTPRGVALDAARLRQGTVLTGRPGGPHLEVGNTRVGTTTRLT